MVAMRATLLLSLLSVPISAGAEAVWAELDSPHQGQVVREPVGLVEVRGWAGTGQRGSPRHGAFDHIREDIVCARR